MERLVLVTVLELQLRWYIFTRSQRKSDSMAKICYGRKDNEKSYLNKQFVLKALTPHTHPPWPLFGNTWGKHHSLSRNSGVAGALCWFVPVVFCHLEWSCHGLVHQVKGSQPLPRFYFFPRLQLLRSTWRLDHSLGVEENSVWTADTTSQARMCANFNYHLQERCEYPNLRCI